jgi:hypothetical protein
MRQRGQILIVVAILISVTLLLLAVALDAGRLYIERARMKRAVQAAADAGISVVADRMLTQVVARQTIMAGTPSPTPPGISTPTPPLSDVVAWLMDEDRATLVSDEVVADAEAAARDYAARNGLDPADPDTLSLEISYPQDGYMPENIAIRSLRLLVRVRRQTTVLLAGLLGEVFVNLDAEGLSEIPQR